MNLPFGSKDDDDDEPPEETGGTDTTETEMVEVEKSMSYTEHDAVARFVDGSEQEHTFDSMERDGNAIVLKRFTGVTTGLPSMFGAPNIRTETEAFVTIPYANLTEFETVERREKTMEYTELQEREAEADE